MFAKRTKLSVNHRAGNSTLNETSNLEQTPVSSQLKKINARNLSQSFLQVSAETSLQPREKVSLKVKVTNSKVVRNDVVDRENQPTLDRNTSSAKKTNLSTKKRTSRGGMSKQRKNTFGPTPCKNLICAAQNEVRSGKKKVMKRKSKPVKKNLNKHAADESVCQDGALLDIEPWDIGEKRTASDMNELDIVLEIIQQTYMELRDSGILEHQNSAVKEAAKNFCQRSMKKFSRHILVTQEIKKLKQELSKQKSKVKELDVQMNDARCNLIRKKFDVDKLRNQMQANDTQLQKDNITEFLAKLSKA